MKTDNGYRDIPIHDKIFVKLIEYKKLQQGEKELAGSAYTDNEYVFANQIGVPLNRQQCVICLTAYHLKQNSAITTFMLCATHLRQEQLKTEFPLKRSVICLAILPFN